MAAAEEAEDHHAPKQPHLAKQDAATVDPAKLTALTPEVVSLHGIPLGCTFCIFLTALSLTPYRRFLVKLQSMLVRLATSLTASPLS